MVSLAIILGLLPVALHPSANQVYIGEIDNQLRHKQRVFAV
jgi:hypothetical protein